jgi:hypothetical protein
MALGILDKVMGGKKWGIFSRAETWRWIRCRGFYTTCDEEVTYPKGRESDDRSVPTAYSRYAIEVRVLSFGLPTIKRHGIQGTTLGINDVQMFGIV